MKLIKTIFILTLSFTWGCSTSLQNNKNIELSVLEVGSSLPDLDLDDQFGTTHHLGKNVKNIVFAFDMELAKSTNLLLSESPEFLSEHKIQYVSDISPMPAIISKLFAKPKMRSYPFPIILIDNTEFTQTVPKSKGKLTILTLEENRLISKIQFLDSIKEID